jgi:tryptophan halogenase
VFLEASWIAVYLGQRVIPLGHDLRAGIPSPDALARGMETLRGQIKASAEAMPDHMAMLSRYCPMAA